MRQVKRAVLRVRDLDALVGQLGSCALRHQRTQMGCVLVGEQTDGLIPEGGLQVDAQRS